MKHKPFGIFWYSVGQWHMKREMSWDIPSHTNYMRPLFGGKPRAYTECSLYPNLHLRPAGNWDDYKFVGIGFYDHTTTP